ncbi:hypothetical protein [Micromonospora echinospora]|uniref:hypothetical protein n=1 Tax=Micromonospora echinospora TaxID=1877 RepID=UPI003673142C
MATKQRTRYLVMAAVTCSAIALVVSFLALAVSISSGYQAAPGTEQPKITDWMQAWGSIAGVITGLLAALAAGFLFWHERQKAHEAQVQTDEDRREAALNAARAVGCSSAQIEEHDDHATVTVSVHNHGPSPVSMVKAVVAVAARGKYILPTVYFLPPGVHEPLVGRYESGPGRSGWSDLVTLYFTDASQRTWRKTGHGEPERWEGPCPSLEDAEGAVRRA